MLLFWEVTMKPKYFFTVLIIFLFIYISPLFSQTAKITAGNFQNSQYSSYDHGENINFRIINADFDNFCFVACVVIG